MPGLADMGFGSVERLLALFVRGPLPPEMTIHSRPLNASHGDGMMKMGKRKVEIVVLCEDAQHESFIRRYLRALDFNPAQFRIRAYPAGARAGEQWVRERHPEEAKLQRSRANHTNASLIAVIDADTLSVEQRVRQLDDALHGVGHVRRQGHERIAIVIPRRNIESWVHFAETREIDETTDFKQRYRGTKACRNAADVAIDACRTNADQSQIPPSLAVACQELRRVVQP